MSDGATEAMMDKRMETFMAMQEMAEDFATADHEIVFVQDEEVFTPHEHTDSVNMIESPAHYQGTYGGECIDAIADAMTEEEFRGYCKGNAIKYIWRERLKGGDESLRKAIQNLKFALGEE